MNNTPTPETDAAWSCFKGHTELLHDVRNLSRKLERERDEARKQLCVAVGMLSTHPQFENKHPAEVLEFVKEAAK